MSTPNQPTLPSEVAFTEAEFNFIDESPPELFPSNQNSNLGLFRKIWSDKMQELIDQVVLMNREMFVQTADQFLDEWEEMTGLPQAPAGRSVTDRRLRVMARLRSGVFTKELRRRAVEDFILPQLSGGEAVQILPSGVPLTPAGVPLYSGLSGNVTDFYTITENVPNFSYNVDISNLIAVDLVALQAELRRITPAHINFTINSVVVTPPPPVSGNFGDGTFGSNTFGG